jgi:hypothetical protein
LAQRVRPLAALADLVTGVRDGLLGTGHSLIKSGGHLADCGRSVARGRVGAGARSLGAACGKLALQTPADLVLMVGGRAVSSVQQLTWIETPGRGLDEREREVLRSVYRDAVALDRIVIKRGRAGVFGLNARPFTHGDVIYMKDIGESRWLDIIVHEVCHVWQHQHGGTDYMTRALWAQAVGDGYDWHKGIDAGTPWRELNPEQQAEMIETAYSMGYFDRDGQRFVSIGTDYTEQLEDALRLVRDGRR